MRRRLAAGALVAIAWGAAAAHELRPGLLELRETEAGTYDLLWKAPSGEGAIPIAPAVPDGCTLGATLRCEGGLAGKTLRVAGLESTATDVFVRIHHADGRLESHLLRPDAPEVRLGGTKTAVERSLDYGTLGLRHVLLGVDHLLFVLGLILIVPDRWSLLKTVTAFTLAHSLTLAIATLGWASVPLPPLNAAIALSILFLGPEIVRARRGETSFTIRHPWVVAFAFGLLHGFGFASGLAAMGLPKGELPLALLLFNVGVEVGQVAFVGLVLLLKRSFRVLEIRWARAVEALPAYTVGTLGAFWTIQRVIALLTVLLVVAPVFAHAQSEPSAGFLPGVHHPLSGLDHVVAMVAVGVWGAQLGAPAVWLLPLTFPLVMACGGFLALIGVPIPGVEIGIALSALLLGGMVACEAKPPLGVATALVGGFAIFHGHAHGAELPPGASGLPYSVGFVLATGALHALGIALGTVGRFPRGRVLLRGTGGAIAAVGLWFLWRALG